MTQVIHTKIKDNIIFAKFGSYDSIAMAKCQVDYFKRQGIDSFNENNIVFIHYLRGKEKVLF